MLFSISILINCGKFSKKNAFLSEEIARKLDERFGPNNNNTQRFNEYIQSIGVSDSDIEKQLSQDAQYENCTFLGFHINGSEQYLSRFQNAEKCKFKIFQACYRKIINSKRKCEKCRSFYSKETPTCKACESKTSSNNKCNKNHFENNNENDSNCNLINSNNNNDIEEEINDENEEEKTELLQNENTPGNGRATSC